MVYSNKSVTDSCPFDILNGLGELMNIFIRGTDGTYPTTQSNEQYGGNVTTETVKYGTKTTEVTGCVGRLRSLFDRDHSSC